MADAWEELQAIKNKRNSLKERLQNRKKVILSSGNSLTNPSSPLPDVKTGILDGLPQYLDAGCAGPDVAACFDAKKKSVNGLCSGDAPLAVAVAVAADEEKKPMPEIEQLLLKILCDLVLALPVDSQYLLQSVEKMLDERGGDEQCWRIANANTLLNIIDNLLQKFALQDLICLQEIAKDGKSVLEVTSTEHSRLAAMINIDQQNTQHPASLLIDTGIKIDPSFQQNEQTEPTSTAKRKATDIANGMGDSPGLALGKSGDILSERIKTEATRQAVAANRDENERDGLTGCQLAPPQPQPQPQSQPQPPPRKKEKKEQQQANNKSIQDNDIMSLLSLPSTREKETKKLGEEILDLLSKPTAKERSLTERFRSQGGAQVMEFCPYGTKQDCLKMMEGEVGQCSRLHFKKIIQKHTDELLGDCSFLNTCFHMESCKYVHYEVDSEDLQKEGSKSETADVRTSCGSVAPLPNHSTEQTILYPPQWIQCDLRYLDTTVLGKCAVIMADPPWDIHMELPYGTMSDDEMRQLNIPALQDEGLIFLWVTGRAMELGRECLRLWGYDRVDEIIWVKTNQLQRIIRTGRTGHWLNHGKEHCLVGMKGNPSFLNRSLDCDIIVAEVRATSHKPDEIYGIIERLSPGTRKVELFGRRHNIQPNWITLGNQVDGVRLVDPELIERFQKRYPDGNCMVPPKQT